VIAVRSFLFHFIFCIWTTFVCIAALPALLMSQRAVSRVSQIWATVSLLLLRVIVGLSYEVRGRHNFSQASTIVALKHQSAWDTIAVWVLLENPAIVVKQSLARIPVFGWYVRKGKAIVIDREAGSKALRPMIVEARLAAAEGRSIVIFPEGTRTSVGARQPYHPGVAALYMQLGLPIVPAALNSGLFWGRNSFLIRPGCILVEFLPPIGPGFDRRVVLSELKDCIEQATARLVAENNVKKWPGSC
jgi:1-acyl-sn-glycerol-3-phosphate acyltransferase